MDIKQILAYRPKLKTEQSLRERALRLLAGFLGVMLIFTFLSRAADSLTVAQVDVSKPTQSSIIHTISADGMLEAAGRQGVTVPEGVLVDSVLVREGQKVAPGDPLFSLDGEDLREQMTTVRLEMEKLTLQAKEQEEQEVVEETKREIALRRAQEDLERAIEDAEERIDRLGDEMKDARSRLRIYKDEYEDAIDDWEDDDILPEEDGYSIISGYRSLKDDYKSKMYAYQDAKKEQDKAVLDAQRAIEDAELEPNKSYQAQIAALENQLKWLSLNKLEKVSSANGIVTAQTEGIVTNILVEEGKRTGNEAAVLLADSEAGLRFTARMTEEDCRYISRGSSAEISCKGKSMPVATTIASVKSLADQPGMMEVTAYLSDSEGEIGSQASMTVTSKSDTFSYVLPISALRSDGIRSYIFIVEDTQTALGTEQAVTRVDVVVQDRNESKCAVSGSIPSGAQVVTASSKNLQAGDRVRLRNP